MTQQIKAGRKRFEHSKKHRWRCHQQFCWTSTWLARTEDVVTYTEFCKQQQPSISAEEIQRKLVDNNVCLRENCPSTSSITRALREDLGYSYKRLNVTARESLTANTEQRLLEYLTACSTIDPTNMYFLDECSVIKTTGNRRYGHWQIGAPAVEIQRYASNANFTVSLLHSIFGISHVNVLNGPSKWIGATESLFWGPRGKRCFRKSCAETRWHGDNGQLWIPPRETCWACSKKYASSKWMYLTISASLSSRV